MPGSAAMTAVYLALRHQDPPGLRGLFALLIRGRLVTGFPHAGIVTAEALYHSTLSDGVHQAPAPAEGWLLLPTAVPYDAAMARIRQRLGLRYDLLSLAAFLLPWRVRDSMADYCYEFAYYVLTGQKPTGRVTAETLLLLVAVMQAGQTTTEGPHHGAARS